MLGTLQTIQSFVAPVVMISANGLLCLAFFNRMAAVVHRVREINRERFELAARLAVIDGSDAVSAVMSPATVRRLPNFIVELPLSPVMPTLTVYISPGMLSPSTTRSASDIMMLSAA